MSVSIYAPLRSPRLLPLSVALTCRPRRANLYGMLGTKEEILARLRSLKPEAVRLYRVRDIALFGSVARDEQGAASDVDVLVDFTADADLLDQVGLTLMLEERLGCAVDVVPRRALRPEFADSVLDSVVSV